MADRSCRGSSGVGTAGVPDPGRQPPLAPLLLMVDPTLSARPAARNYLREVMLQKISSCALAPHLEIH